MSDSDKPAISRTKSEDMPRPSSRGEPTIEETIDILVIRVDRLQQTNKLLRWAAVVATTFALGSAVAVARSLYGMGVDDASVRISIERLNATVSENRADLKELQRFVYSRTGRNLMFPSFDGKDQQ